MRMLWSFAICVVCVVQGSFAVAQELTIAVGYGKVFRYDQPVENVFVGSDDILTVQPVSETSFFVGGRQPGYTNLIVMNEFEEIIDRKFVAVIPESDAIGTILKTLLPNGNIKLRRAGDVDIFVGTAHTPEEAFAVLEARKELEAQGRRVIDNTSYTAPTQVGLRVRIVELFRSELRRLGFDLSGYSGNAPFRVETGQGVASDFLGNSGNGNALGLQKIGAGVGIGSLDINAVIDALEEQSILQVISEPVLTTLSGKRATFKSGAEFATPVNQGNGVFVNEYRSTGVSIEFLPEILSNGRISLEIEPEIRFSQDDVDPGNQVSVSAASTSVEVSSGETFIIAGLHERVSRDVKQNVPGVFRKLVTGRQRSRDEREIIFFVTPYLSDGTVKKAQKREIPVHLTIGFVVK